VDFEVACFEPDCSGGVTDTPAVETSRLGVERAAETELPPSADSDVDAFEAGAAESKGKRYKKKASERCMASPQTINPPSARLNTISW